MNIFYKRIKHKSNLYLAVFIFIIISSSTLFSQNMPSYDLPGVIVTAGRTPVTFSELTRDVSVIYPEQIKSAPVNSIQDLLKYVSGVDLKSRGIDGVQSDVSIRGGTFEETLVLIDGVKMSDPQTGHHNLNLPVNLDDVERIEILKGQGSRIFGPNAFSGVINIITKKPHETTMSAQLSGGQNNFYEGSLSAAWGVGVFSNRASISKKKSDGYIYNTYFDISNVSYGASLNTPAGVINLLAGYNDKTFGANSFYSSLYPNQWEHTKTKLVNLSGELGNSDLYFSPKIFWRHHDDDYILDFNRPAFYRNIHKTDSYGFEIQSSLKSSIGTTSFGGEYSKDKIESTNLGNHSREKKGIFAEQLFEPLQNLTFQAGAFVYNYAEVGWKFWPGFDAGYKFENTRIFASIGKAFRIPTYTELYYKSPVQSGNPDLKYEETLNYEIGVVHNLKGADLNLSLFRKEGKNIIDWTRAVSTDVWMVRNIAEINTNGIEAGVAVHPDQYITELPVKTVSVSYTYLNADKKTEGFQSQYLLDHLRNQLIINVAHDFFFDIKANWLFRYEDRINFEDHFLTDLDISRRIDQFDVFIKATNIFNKPYMDITGVALPGRWITAGIKWNMTDN